MTSHTSSFHPRPASAAAPQFEINDDHDDHDDLMAGSDFETEQEAIHRSSASTSFANASPKQNANLRGNNGLPSSTPPSTPRDVQGHSAASALRDSTIPRHIHHRTEVLAEDSPIRFSAAGLSHSPSRSPSSLFSAGSGEEDEDEDEYLPSDSGNEHEDADDTQYSSASLNRTAQMASSCMAARVANVYCDDEDAILINAVKRHGTLWAEVSKDFHALSTGPARTPGSLKGRWFALCKRKGGPPAGTTAPKSRLWSPDETIVLQKILDQHRKTKGRPSQPAIYADFLRAFPQSTRPANGIRQKCQQLLQEQGNHRRSADPRDGGATSFTASSLTLSSLQSPGQSSQPPRRRLHAASHVRHSTNNSDSPVDSFDNSEQEASMAQRRECPHALRPATSTQGNARPSRRHAEPTPQQQPQQQTNRQRQPQAPQAAAQPLDVNVLIEQKSVCIEICSRDFHVAVYSETLIKITREAPPPSAIAFGTSYEAAFLFYVRANGAIRALRLPEDTTTDVTPVPPSESCDGGAYVDTVFTGPDDFVVLFRSRL